MPLKKGKSRKVFLENLRELIASWKAKGKIGNIRPKNKKHALKIALAIAFKQQRSGK